MPSCIVIIDFKLLKEIPPPVVINEENVEIVQKYKYLCIVIDLKLNWGEQVNILINSFPTLAMVGCIFYNRFEKIAPILLKTFPKF